MKRLIYLLIPFAACVFGTLFAEEIFALTASGKLARFTSNSSATGQFTQLSLLPITGLQPSETLLGIDFRPTSGQLYALGSSSRLYVINTATGATSLGASAFATLLNGVHFGVDFHPFADRMRVVSDANQNQRLNPDTGTVAVNDTALTYAPGDPAAGTAPRIVSIAYTNNSDIGAATTLYGIDSNLDTLVTIGSVNGPISPNSGITFTVGKLGIDATDIVGFDISGQTGIGYVSVTSAAGTTNLYTVNLATGTLSQIGVLAVAGETFTDIALPTAPTYFDMVVLRNNNNLMRLDTRFPNASRPTVSIKGLQAGESIVEIDFRPANGVLYGIASPTARIYTLDPATGVATAVGTGTVLPPPTTFNMGFDFNPITGLLRVVNDAQQNFRIDADAGTTLVLDSNLAYAVGDSNAAATPSIVASAYSNNVAGVTTTTLYGIDQALGILVVQTPPNNGTLNTIGSLALGTNLGTAIGFDITPAGAAYLAANNSLYSVNLTTGAATLISSIGGGNVRGIAAVTQTQQVLQFSAVMFLGIEGNTIALDVQRVGPATGTVSADFSIQDGSAVSPLNYIASSGTLTFLDGESTHQILVQTSNDHVLSLLKTATVTLSNAIGANIGAPAVATFGIFDVNDIDGDGFPNDVETAAGTDPNNPASTPFNGLPAGATQPLTISKASIKLNFAKPIGSDSVSFGGTLPNPLASIPAGTKVTAEIGSVLGKPGVVQVFTLDAKSKSTPKGLTISKPKSGISKFSVSISKGTFAALLAPAGLTNTNATKAPLTVSFNLYFNNITFGSALAMTYTAKQGKAGSATKTK